MTAAHHVGHLGQVLDAALRDRIGELGQPMPARQMHVLDLDVAQPLFGALEQEVDAAVVAVFHLAAQARIARKRLDAPGLDRLGDQLDWGGRC